VGQPMVYNFQGIEGGAGELDTSVARTEALLVEGKESLVRLAAQWESDASMSWQAAQNRWDANALELNLALQSLSTTIRDAGINMCLLDKNVGSSFTA
jgi:6 kDa early secretory antigenic target